MDPGRSTFDVGVIGAGPGGYVAAVRAAQLGFRVALIDERTSLGGTCLNVGCIPSKALLESSERYHEARHELADHGVMAGEIGLDLGAMMRRKDRVVATMAAGLTQLMAANRIATFTGRASLRSPGAVAITAAGQPERVITAGRLVLATGSAPVELPSIPFDHVRIVDSTDALAFDAVPARLVVVGAGAIGLEMASVWSRLGAAVTVVELMPQILPGWDGHVARGLQRILEKQGIRILTSASVKEVQTEGGRLRVVIAAGGGSEPAAVEADRVLVAVGRRPSTAGLELARAGVVTDARGFVQTDKGFRTSLENIYAIGDVKGAPMLAHKAEAEGIALAEILAGKPAAVNYDAIPGVVYTAPEAASVGRTEEALKKAGIPCRSGVFPFRANGRAQASGRTDGFVKVLSEVGSDRVLGVHMVGACASELIAEAVSVMEFGGSAEDIARTVHAHPTLSEAIMEAALAVEGGSIHTPPARTGPQKPAE
jgi:dihydrolipoamide dehydrogenase